MTILPYYNYLLNDFNKNIIIPEYNTIIIFFYYLCYYYMYELFDKLIDKTLEIYNSNNYDFNKKIQLIQHKLIINDKNISETKLHDIFSNLITNNLIYNLLLFFIFKVQGNIYVKCNKYHSHYYNDSHDKTNKYIILNVYDEYKFWQNICGGKNKFHFDMFKNNVYQVNFNITFDDNTQFNISLENLRFISWVYYSGIYNFIISKNQLCIKLLLDAMNERKLLKGNELLQYHLGTIVFEEENKINNELYDESNSIWETDSELDNSSNVESNNESESNLESDNESNLKSDNESNLESDNESESDLESDNENESDLESESNNESDLESDNENESDLESDNENEYSKMLNKLDNRMDIISLGNEIMNSLYNIFYRINNLLR